MVKGIQVDGMPKDRKMRQVPLARRHGQQSAVAMEEAYVVETPSREAMGWGHMGWELGTVKRVTKKCIWIEDQTTGVVKRFLKRRVRKIYMQPIMLMCYITLPGMESKHVGHSYKGFCVER